MLLTLFQGNLQNAGAAALTGEASTQDATSGAGAVNQVHALAGAASSQTAASTSAAASQTHALAGAAGSQAAATTSGAIGQTHSLAAGATTQANATEVGAISIGAQPLTGAATTQNAETTSGAISSAEPVATGGGFGFEMSGGGVRTVSFKPLMQRIREARAGRLARLKPKRKAAQRKAAAIEVKAAELAVSGGNESAFMALMRQWLAQTPMLTNAPDDDAEQLFLAQVGLRLRQIEQAEQDDEEAVLALLLA